MSTRPYTPCHALIAAAALALVCHGAPAVHAQTNLLFDGTLEAFGTQAAGLVAVNTHDGVISSRWESADPLMNEYFIFSFLNNAEASFPSLNLYNEDTDAALKYFQMFYSSDDAARTDPGHASWMPIPSTGAFATEKHNLINIRLGATLEAFGSERGTDGRAPHIGDGTKGTEWESANHHPDDYFIYAFEGENTEQADSLVLFNNKNKGAKKFTIFYSSDAAAKTDPHHASWVQIGGTHNAAKTANAQSYTFAPVSGRYFLFRVVEGHHPVREMIAELQLYGPKTKGEGNVWVAQQTATLQTFTFAQVSGKYFRFQTGGNYDASTTSIFELELIGGQGGLSVQRWREVIR